MQLPELHVCLHLMSTKHCCFRPTGVLASLARVAAGSAFRCGSGSLVAGPLRHSSGPRWPSGRGMVPVEGGPRGWGAGVRAQGSWPL